MRQCKLTYLKRMHEKHEDQHEQIIDVEINLDPPKKSRTSEKMWRQKLK